jgi:acetyl-CoA acetyltransferase
LREAFVYEAVRTPRGRVRKDGGTLAGVPACELLAGLLTGLTARGVPADAVQDVIAGVIPVRRGGETLLAADEGARAGTTMESLAALPPLFGGDPLWARVGRRFPGFTRPAEGLHTVATAPQLCGGASAALIGSADARQALGREPVGRIAGWAHTAVRSPGLDGTAEAARLALQRAGVAPADVDVAEFNESFSVTPLLLIGELGIDPERVNVHGGAVAVGTRSAPAAASCSPTHSSCPAAAAAGTRCSSCPRPSASRWPWWRSGCADGAAVLMEGAG